VSDTEFQPAPEVLELAGQSRRLFEQHGDLRRALELSDSDLCFDGDLWTEMSDLGWADLFDSTDLTPEVAIDACVALLCEVGRSQAAVPLASRLITGWVRGRLDPDGTVPRGTGASIPALVADADWHEFDGLTLNGTAELVRDGSVASELLCIVPFKDRPRAVRVEVDAHGVSVTQRRATGRLREASIVFAAVPVAPENVLPAALDEHVLRDLVAIRALLDGAELVGLARRMLELAVEHAQSRVQFGRPIGQFQAIRHRLADMLIDVDVAAALLYRLAAALAHGEDPSPSASYLALWNRRAIRRVALGAHQIHGGVGFIRDHPLHLMFGRAIAPGPGNTADRSVILGQILPTRPETRSDGQRAGWSEFGARS
jgi:hypothetical protein